MPRRPIERTKANGHAAGRRPKAIDWHTFDPSKVRGDTALVEELTTYRDHLDELLDRKGQFVLIKGRRVVGIFQDQQGAVEKAVDLFGGEPVLVRRIVAKEPIHATGGVIL